MPCTVLGLSLTYSGVIGLSAVVWEEYGIFSSVVYISQCASTSCAWHHRLAVLSVSPQPPTLRDDSSVHGWLLYYPVSVPEKVHKSPSDAAQAWINHPCRSSVRSLSINSKEAQDMLESYAHFSSLGVSQRSTKAVQAWTWACPRLLPLCSINNKDIEETCVSEALVSSSLDVLQESTDVV